MRIQIVEDDRALSDGIRLALREERRWKWHMKRQYRPSEWPDLEKLTKR